MPAACRLLACLCSKPHPAACLHARATPRLPPSCLNCSDAGDEEGAGAVLAAVARPGSGLAGDDTSSTDEEMAAVPRADAPPSARRHLSPALRRDVAALLLRLASKAQFAKVGRAAGSCSAGSALGWGSGAAALCSSGLLLCVLLRGAPCCSVLPLFCCLSARSNPSACGMPPLPLQDKGSARVASQVLSALAHLTPDLVLVSSHP